MFHLVWLLACGGPEGQDRGGDTDGNGGTDDSPPCTPQTWYLDGDGDGFGDPATEVTSCDPVADGVEKGGDCDDGDRAIHPAAVEVCDTGAVDEDCDGGADDADPQGAEGGVYAWPDGDGDGHGDASAARQSLCVVGSGLSLDDKDCDDADDTTFRGAAFLELPGRCTSDADGDGFASAAPPSAAAVAGTDCDDTDATVFPGAVEILADRLDQDCDTLEDYELFDDFDSGSPASDVWLTTTGDWNTGTLYTWSDWWSLDLSGGGARFDTVTVDTTACVDLAWSFYGKRGPDQPDPGERVEVQYWNGAAFVTVDTWLGGDTDDDFALRQGLLPADAYRSDFAMRLDRTGGSQGIDTFYVDDFWLVCPGLDGDGDGAGEFVDCDDADSQHWSDCATCIDTDGDGWGSSCNLGDDCDDADIDANPGAPDPLGDGDDTDCDGHDGAGVFDDFELGAGNLNTWTSITGDAEVVTNHAASGLWSLDLAGGGGVAETTPIDVTTCPSVKWSYLVKRSGNIPESGDALVVELWDGAAFVAVDSFPGDGDADPLFIPRLGVVSNPAFLRSDLKGRLVSVGTDVAADDFFVDDFALRCFLDSDGDLIDDETDCADGDPRHWADCAACVDGDDDGFGVACDLGPDCNDSDPDIHPNRPDPIDGIDRDCDGTDGTVRFDDFELGVLDPEVWATLSGDGSVQTQYSAGGAWALNLGGGGATATTLPLDTSACPSVTWSFLGKRGPETPDNGDDIDIYFNSPVGRQFADTWSGEGVTDGTFSLIWGTLTDPAALWSGFSLELDSNGSGFGFDDFFIDDFAFGCTEDADLDGSPSVVDCDDSDPAHWSDCGLCTDADGDDYGVGCDLGADCDDGDPSQNPDALDDITDGIDTNCDRIDGLPLLFDDFETGGLDPAVWSAFLLDVGIDNTTVASGAFSLRLGGGGGSALSVTVDTSACAAVGWHWLGKRGPDTPENGDDLYFEWDDGVAWNTALRWEGTGVLDPVFDDLSGTIGNPAALHPAFRVSFTPVGGAAGTDEFYIDDFAIGCAP